MSRVYLVRHGQTAWNVGEIFRGRADIPLDETGKHEVHLAGETIKDEALHAVPDHSSWAKKKKVVSSAIATR